MKQPSATFWSGILSLGILSVGVARAETIELVTYYPTSSNQGDLHVDSLTVGDAYNGVKPANGVVAISNRLWVGTGFDPAAPAGSIFQVAGVDSAVSNVVFMPGTGAGAEIRVGIGTATPSTRVQVMGGGINVGPVALPAAQLYEGNLITTGAFNALHFARRDLAAWPATLAAGDVYAWYSPTAARASLWTPVRGDLLSVTNAGNVGIGTTAPQYPLDVNGNVQFSGNRLYLAGGGGAADLFWIMQGGSTESTNNALGFNASYGGSQPVIWARWPFYFTGALQGVDNGFRNSKLVLNPNGDAVGIGTSNPAGELNVHSQTTQGNMLISGASDNGHTYAGLYFSDQNQNSRTNGWIIAFKNDAGQPWSKSLEFIRNSSICMQMNPDGKVGIGTSAPGFLLEVNGSAGKPGGGSWSTSSDVRLKKNVQPMAGALEKMLALRGVTFEWKDPASQGNLTGTQMGMIGQEVAKVFPGWVSEDPQGMKVLSIRGFEALTVEAMRELKEENESLRREVQALKSKLKE